MQLERVHPTIYKVTLHTYELTALISASRWVADGAKGELPQEAREQLSQILATYDEQSKRMSSQEKST